MAKLTSADFGFSTAVLKKYPSLRGVVDRAIKGKWTADRFKAEVKDTDFWMKRTESQRKFDLDSAQDPDNVTSQVVAKADSLKRLAETMGVTLTWNQLEAQARKALRNDLDDDEIRAFIGSAWTAPKDLGAARLTGVASQTVDELTKVAASYGVPVSSETVQGQVRGILSGTGSVESNVDYYREQAKVLYSGLADKLDAGYTVQDLADPFMEQAAKELGVSRSAMSLSDPKWTRALTGSQTTPKGPMTMDEWQTTLRSDPGYGWDKTSGARQQAASLGSQLAQMMGAR